MVPNSGTLWVFRISHGFRNPNSGTLWVFRIRYGFRAPNLEKQIIKA